MAKSARSSSNKTNNQKLKSRVFGPVEAARNERLSAKLLELAAAPKPVKEIVVDTAEKESAKLKDLAGDPTVDKQSGDMDVDQAAGEAESKPASQKGRIEKRRRHRSKASIIFPNKFKDGKPIPKSKRR